MPSLRSMGRSRPLAFSLASLLLHSVAQAAIPLRLAVSDGPVSLPIYVAQARGFFADEGLAVQTIPCVSGLACMKKLRDAGADVATAAELPVALDRVEAPALAIIATISSSSHQIKMVGRRSAGGGTPRSLVGKRVGTVAGTSAEFFLDSWLVFHQVDPAAVNVVDIEPERLASALGKQLVDAIAIWEPVAAEAALRLRDDAVVLDSPRVYTQYFNLVCQRQTTRTRKLELSRLLRALIRAQQYIEGNEQDAAEILTARLHVDRTFADASIKDEDYRIRLDRSLLTTISNEIRWVGRGLPEATRARPKDPLSLVDPSVLGGVSPQAVRLDR